MRMLGIVLMMAGFFTAAFFSVRIADSKGLEWETIEWTWYGIAFAVGAVGVVMIRVSAHTDKTQTHKVDADLRVMSETMGRLVSNLSDLNARYDSVDVYTIHQWIDAELAGDLADFAEARESLIPLYGLQRYADLMTQFAAAERLINRSWSASADGYVDEVRISLERAGSLLGRANELLRTYQQADPSTGVATA